MNNNISWKYNNSPVIFIRKALIGHCFLGLDEEKYYFTFYECNKNRIVCNCRWKVLISNNKISITDAQIMSNFSFTVYCCELHEIAKRFQLYEYVLETRALSLPNKDASGVVGILRKKILTGTLNTGCTFFSRNMRLQYLFKWLL